jgi:hypothetical protein
MQRVQGYIQAKLRVMYRQTILRVYLVKNKRRVRGCRIVRECISRNERIHELNVDLPVQRLRFVRVGLAKIVKHDTYNDDLENVLSITRENVKQDAPTGLQTTECILNGNSHAAVLVVESVPGANENTHTHTHTHTHARTHANSHTYAHDE